MVVACDGLEQRGAGLAPPDVLVRPASVDQPGSGRPSARLLPVGQLPEQAAHQLADGGRRAGAEGPRFGGGLGEDVFVQVLEGLTPRSGRSVESGQGDTFSATPPRIAL